MLIKQWIGQLAAREKLTLLLGSVILSVILIYFLILLPLIEKKQQLDNVINEQKVTLQWMYAAADEIQQLQTLPVTSTNTTPLLTLIDQQIATLGKVNKRIEPQSEQVVQMSLEEVDFSTLIQWLANLYNQQHIQVIAMTIEPLSNPDKVKIRMTLEQG